MRIVTPVPAGGKRRALLVVLFLPALLNVLPPVLGPALLPGLCPASLPGTALAADEELSLQGARRPEAGARDPGEFGAKLRWFFWIFLMLSAAGLALLILAGFFLVWKAKQIVENATKPDVPALERLLERKRRKHPDLSDEALARKLIHRQALRSGFVGFVTGLGGLPVLPVTVPIDIAATIKIQSNLVYLLQMVRRDQPGPGSEEISRASLWLLSTGGQELTTASSKMVQRLLVKYLSKSLLKFLPILGGVVGFALNWTSTQALGRLTLKRL